MTAPKDTPAAKAVQAAMAEASAATQSELHPLYGKAVTIGDCGDVPGGPAVIDYAVGERFRATMANGRQPWGLIADLVTEADGSLSYHFKEGA